MFPICDPCSSILYANHYFGKTNALIKYLGWKAVWEKSVNGPSMKCGLCGMPTDWLLETYNFVPLIIK